MIDLLPFGPGAWAFIALYLLGMLAVGGVAWRARRDDTLADFYLAGRGFGTLVLVMTLFATQYSGNTFFGFSGSTYRMGYAWVMSMHFMIAIIVCYLAFAPRLRLLARERGYLTPSDYLLDRYDSPALAKVVAVLMTVALANFLLSQLMAMGRALEGLAGARAGDAERVGAAGLALVMVIYGTLGGMRAVAWTDAIQGGIMLVGLILILWLVVGRYGTLGEATRLLLASGTPADLARVTPPGAERLREWMSYVLMFGLGAAMYPQAIQRIYAARTARALRRSLALMAFLPLPTTFMAIVVGIVGAAYLPGLAGADADRVLSVMLGTVQGESALGYALVVVVVAAVIAAMMSTADSALLSVSSMVTHDLYRPWLRPRASQAELTRVAKVTSWGILALLVAGAIALKGRASIVDLLDRKFDLLVQVAPAFLIGLRWPGLRGGPVLAGLLAGTAIALALAFLPLPFVTGGKVSGFHPGLVGLAVNLAIAVGGSLRLRAPAVVHG